MFEKLITFALQQRLFVLLLGCALLIFGLYSFQQIPIEAFPDVQDVQVQIISLNPGQAPEEVERAITLPIEREMSGVPHMTQLRSVSMTGLSVVTLTFADHTDDYFARQQVLEKLQTVTLPTGVQPSLAPLTTSVGEIYRYVLDAPVGASLADIRGVQDWVVRPALRRVSGVADVISFGGAVREIAVQIHPEALRRYGITLDQVAQALTANNANAGAGVMRRGDEALVVRSLGLFNSLEDVRETEVAAVDGRSIRVADLATVENGVPPRSGMVSYNQRDDVIEGIVDMVKGGNASAIVQDVRAQVDALNRSLPPGYRIHPIYDRTELIGHTVSTVGENLMVGAVLVTFILLLFLHNFRAAGIVAVVIPLSLLFDFVFMHLLGVSANLISLGSVDFGVIIDSAVVLVEALMVKLALANAKFQPVNQQSPYAVGRRIHTLKSTAIELAKPILFSKAIIILAFLPIFTFQRVEGRIFMPVALTLSFALLGGLLLTLTLVPALLSFAVQRDMAEKPSVWLAKLQQAYRQMLERAAVWRRMIIAGSVVLLLVTVAMASWLGSEFLPKLDEGNIWLTITLPPSSAIETTHGVEQKVRAILLRYPEVKSVISHVGRPDDGTDPKGANNMEVLADLKPHGEWRFSSKEALVDSMAMALQGIPGLQTNFSQVIEDSVEEALSGAKGEIAVKVFGPNLQVLETKGQQIAAVLNQIAGAADVEALSLGGQSEIDVQLQRDQLARYGISVDSAHAVIQTALAGQAVSSYYDGERKYDVVLRYAPEFRAQAEDIATLPLALPNGKGSIMVGDVASLTTRQGAARITREAGSRIIIVKANLRGRDQGSFIAEAQKKVAGQVALPTGYRLTWGGQFENQQRAMARLKLIIPITLCLIFTLLFWAFRSLRLALLVLAMVPFILIGGFAGLALAGLHLSVSAAVGFIAVAGISVQNGVIMVEQILEIADRGANRVEAIYSGAVMRLRPIIMTALMAGLGLLPAALSHGIGSETQRPFAIVIVGGIVSATLFTLILLPMLLLGKPSEAPT